MVDFHKPDEPQPQPPRGAIPGHDAGPGPYGPGPGWGAGGQPGYPHPMQPPSTAAMWTHLSALLTITVGASFCCGLGGILGWIAPMTIRNNPRNLQDPLVRHHGAQAMNFGITQGIMVVLGFIMYLSGVMTLSFATVDQQSEPVVPLALPIVLLSVLALLGAFVITGIVFAIIGTVKASRGQMWSYPKFVAWPMVKA